MGQEEHEVGVLQYWEEGVLWPHLRSLGEGSYRRAATSHLSCRCHVLCQLDASCRCVSIDGDADRVVFFTHVGGTFTLLDGDRIAVLAALLLKTLTAELASKHSVSVNLVSLFLTTPLPLCLFPLALVNGPRLWQSYHIALD